MKSKTTKHQIPRQHALERCEKWAEDQLPLRDKLKDKNQTSHFSHLIGTVLDNSDENIAVLRPILIATVLADIPVEKLRDHLEKKGIEVPLWTLANRINATAKWLEFPKVGGSKPSEESQNELADWHSINGYPTPEELDAGWLPVHHRPKSSSEQPHLPRPGK